MVEDAQAAFGNRRLRTEALRRQLLLWLDTEVSQAGTLDARIDRFFLSPMSFFEGGQFTVQETDDAAGSLEANGLIKRAGAWGAPTLRLGITTAGQDCVIDFDGDTRAFLARSAPSAATYNIGSASNIAIAHGQGSTASAFSIEQAIDQSVALAQSIRQVADVLNLAPADLAALDDIESREPSRVRRGLQHISSFAQQSTTGAMERCWRQAHWNSSRCSLAE